MNIIMSVFQKISQGVGQNNLVGGHLYSTKFRHVLGPKRPPGRNCRNEYTARCHCPQNEYAAVMADVIRLIETILA